MTHDEQMTFVVALRPSLDPRLGIHVDAIMNFADMNDATAQRWQLRNRFNPEIRSMMVKVPRGTTGDSWCAAFDRMSRDEQIALYDQAKSL